MKKIYDSYNTHKQSYEGRQANEFIRRWRRKIKKQKKKNRNEGKKTAL